MRRETDIFPRTALTSLSPEKYADQLSTAFPLELVTAVTGLSESFVRRVLGKRTQFPTLRDVLILLNLDAFSETFVPRSRIPDYLLKHSSGIRQSSDQLTITDGQIVHCGCSKQLIQRLPKASIQCVVTSSPYWATRIYEDNVSVQWADGDCCPYGHEQTPEAFIRHTVEFLFLLRESLQPTGSIWWNLMDTYNTRTQIRGNAAETLRAMQGLDKRGWLDHEMRRYSAGHAYLKDGEQCLIPHRVAARASRIGYYVKSVITWAKGQSMPETVDSRVTRELEYVMHLSKVRTPFFDKEAYMTLLPELGGRNAQNESQKLTDVWHFSASSGKDGHGAQFPIELPARCIALTSKPGDVILDPFVGSGTTLLAACNHRRRALGFDVSLKYAQIAAARLTGVCPSASRKTAHKSQRDLFPLADSRESSAGRKQFVCP